MDSRFQQTLLSALTEQLLQDALFVHDEEGRFLKVNQRACDSVGYSQSELLDMTVLDLETDFDLPAAKAAWASLKSNEPTTLRGRHRRKDGSTFPVQVWLAVTDIDGRQVFIGLVRDMSEQHRAAQENKQVAAAQHDSEDLYRNLVEQVADGIFLADHEGRYLEANPAGLKMFGCSLEELRSLSFPNVVVPEQHGRLTNHLAELERAGVVTSEWLFRAKDGSTFFGEVASRRLSDGRLLGILRDITERKHAQTAMRDKDLQYRLAIETSVDGFWMVDAQGKILQANEAYARMSGYTAEQLVGLHITDLEAKERPEETAAHIEQIRREGYARFETRHRRKDGSIWPLQVVVTHSPLNGGRSFAFMTDLTAHKTAEEALELAASVYQNSSEGILVTDENNLIIAVNPAFEQLTGYTFDEVRGKNPKIFQSGRQDPAFYKGMWQALSTKGYWSGELWDRRKDGSLHAKDLTINTIRNGDGAICRYVALFSDVTDKKKQEELIWQQANYDALTKLPNRQMFQDRLQMEARKAKRAELSIAVLLLDLDRFKEVNDTLGHETGDLLLIDAAQRISSCVREADTVARLGGDEFVIILSELIEPGIVERVAREILGRLAQPFPLGSHQAYISASIGISLYPQDTQSLEALLRNADQAMYVAKGAGRNCFSYFTPELQAEAEKRLLLTNDLRTAIAKEQFRVFYQPIVELSTGRIRKAEALIRWQHPERGLVSPAEFVPLAEETGLIIPIGNWVFMQAVEQVKKWRQTLGPSFQVSVNKSPVQVRSEDKAHISWASYLQQHGVDGNSIAIELTEGLLLNANSGTNAKLLQMRDAGMQVAIDDFGTGYSSLAYLKKFDIDYLKIDQSFVRNLAPDGEDLALCEAIIVMAHKLGLMVIAEGIETQEQRNLLVAAGCDFGQGYLFARAMPAAVFEEQALVIEASQSTHMPCQDV